MKEENTYQSINQRINQSIRYYRVPSEVQKSTALTSLLQKIHQNPQPASKSIGFSLWLRPALAAAAVLVIAVVLWVMLASEHIRNEGSQSASLRLPDKSRIVLAPESSVYFRKFGWDRKVRMEGKVYFEVEKGSKFRVITSNGSIEVLGTRFMVDESDDQMEVFCYEGKVNAEFMNEQVMLTAGSGASFENGVEARSLAGNETYPGFARFKGNYHAAPLNKVLKDVEEFYGITITRNGNLTHSFSGSIDSGNMEAVLSIITGSFGMDFKIIDAKNIEINQSIN